MLRKKLGAAFRTLKKDGFLGLGDLAARRLGELIRKPVPPPVTPRPPTRASERPPDLFALELSYRYASCDDLIKLKAKYPAYCFSSGANNSGGWGLKQVGTLFCVEKLRQIAPTTILEVGAGYTTFFDEHFGERHEYWMIDDVGFYSPSKFEASMQKRQNTRFVRGLLGSHSSELPDDYFDMVFSISVIEHVPAEQTVELYRDMFRITKPGGYIVHSIDLRNEALGLRDFAHIDRAGFTLSARPDLQIRLDRNPTLFEPLDLVFLYYGQQEDVWANPRAITQHYPTILVVAQKPPLT